MNCLFCGTPVHIYDSPEVRGWVHDSIAAMIACTKDAGPLCLGCGGQWNEPCACTQLAIGESGTGEAAERASGGSPAGSAQTGRSGGQTGIRYLVCHADGRDELADSGRGLAIGAGR